MAPYNLYTANIKGQEITVNSNQKGENDKFSASEHQAPRNLLCNICGKTVKSKLSRHMERHSEQPLYRCNVCGKSYRGKNSLKEHTMSHSQPSEWFYKCDICEVPFGNESRLNRHKEIHSDARPFECKICGKGFKQRAGLFMHEQCHSKDRPYRCDICGRAFKQKFKATRHRALHLRELPECSICGKRFKHHTDQKRHKNVHTKPNEQRCTICEKGSSPTSRKSTNFCMKAVLNKRLISQGA